MMKINQKGFSVVGILVVIVVIGLLGVAGWLVYKRQHTQNKLEISTATTGSAKVADTTKPLPADTSTELTTYIDEYVSFKHPKNWIVTRSYTFADPYGALSIDIKAPVDSTLKPADTKSFKNLYLASSILIAKDGRFTGNCAGCGQVYSVESIETADRSVGSMIISESGMPGEPAFIDVVSGQIAVGDKDFTPSGLRVSSKYRVRVSGSYMSGDMSLIGFKTVDGIKDSKQYGLLRDLIKTIQVQVSNLPN